MHNALTTIQKSQVRVLGRLRFPHSTQMHGDMPGRGREREGRGKRKEGENIQGSSSSYPHLSLCLRPVGFLGLVIPCNLVPGTREACFRPVLGLASAFWGQVTLAQLPKHLVHLLSLHYDHDAQVPSGGQMHNCILCQTRFKNQHHPPFEGVKPRNLPQEKRVYVCFSFLCLFCFILVCLPVCFLKRERGAVKMGG